MNQAAIEFFFDFVSPYGYFGATQIEALAARHARQVDWKPVLLGVTVLKVMGLKPLMQTPLKSAYLAHDKPRMAQLLGVPFVQRENMQGVNSLAALRAFLWFKRHHEGLHKRFARRIFDRLWARGEDITAPTDVLEEAIPLGIDAAELESAMRSEAWKEELRRCVDQAVARQVFGTPFFIVDGEPIWGVDRLWMLEHWLTYRSWEPRPKA